MVSMKIAVGMFSVIITATFGTLMPATRVAAQPTETMRFAIMRNGEQIGTHAIEIASAQDHKRIGEGDTGPNTGGMGAYSTDGIVSIRALSRIAPRP